MWVSACEQLRTRSAHFGYIHSLQAHSSVFAVYLYRCVRVQIFKASKVVSAAFKSLIYLAMLISSARTHTQTPAFREHKANLSILRCICTCPYLYSCCKSNTAEIHFSSAYLVFKSLLFAVFTSHTNTYIPKARCCLSPPQNRKFFCTANSNAHSIRRTHKRYSMQFAIFTFNSIQFASLFTSLCIRHRYTCIRGHTLT